MTARIGSTAIKALREEAASIEGLSPWRREPREYACALSQVKTSASTSFAAPYTVQ